VDTGDVEVDDLLREPRRVITDFSEIVIVEIA
jgi:hypothetical protein